MYSVEFTKVHAISVGRCVGEIYPPLNSRCKPRWNRDTGSESWSILKYFLRQKSHYLEKKFMKWTNISCKAVGNNVLNHIDSNKCVKFQKNIVACKKYV